MNEVNENETPNPTPLQQTIAWAAKEGIKILASNSEILIETFKDKTLVSIDTREFAIQNIFKGNKRIKYTIELQADPSLLTVGNIIHYGHEHLCPKILRGI